MMMKTMNQQYQIYDQIHELIEKGHRYHREGELGQEGDLREKRACPISLLSHLVQFVDLLLSHYHKMGVLENA
jgi:hypothetical protein